MDISSFEKILHMIQTTAALIAALIKQGIDKTEEILKIHC